ncbi:MAG: FIG01269488: protein, clustered with ribosomal protein L32p [uncultured Acidimicrobiales bacterium]|uniref:FIG01269488: protein, clustered with ribosomal protein L32p n=1 Tax=uncultured Acidimicrobiales bacterium TaxID=310071 RepID=A0A6J4HMV6_9ACTN|nr:MAG: FIG01269488: protein, clustered with ribosomal protein L32p [uncultured Acidimicrobiales bacterium]
MSIRSPFQVHVGNVLRTGNARRERRSAPLDDLVVLGTEVPLHAEVVVDVELQFVADTALDAVGTVTAPYRGTCRRCLRQVEGQLQVPVRERFEERFVEDETYPVAHSQIDLGPMARDTVMLELPRAPLCREDCQGLCPECGADRNEGGCSCAAPADPRWAALDQLRDP